MGFSIYCTTVEPHLLKHWLSGSPIIQIDLVLHVNMLRFLQN